MTIPTRLARMSIVGNLPTGKSIRPFVGSAASEAVVYRTIGLQDFSMWPEVFFCGSLMTGTMRLYTAKPTADECIDRAIRST